jgi:polyhydroxybutyrate depolymerase
MRNLAALPLALLATVCVSTQPRLARQSWTIDGVERTALIATPMGATPGTPAPVVLVFHGHGGTSLNAARTFDIHTHWPEALVIYPQGLPTPGLVTDPEGQRPGWQQDKGDQGDRDLKLVDEMLAWAKSQYAVDPKHTFATGHSNGGTMTYVLWRNRADRFAAFAPAASVFRGDLGGVTPKPAFIIAGEKDALVPYALQERSLLATLRLDKASVSGTAWSGSARLHASSIGANVVAYIHPGGHPMPADAGALIAKFFKGV